MTKWRENRSGRNQVVWDQSPHWGKKRKNRRGRKKKVGERSERRGRCGEGKGWRFFSLLGPPLGSLRSPICFLFDPVFYLLPARNEEGEGRVSSLSLSQPWLPRFFLLLTFLWAFERLESLSVTARIENWPNYDCLIQELGSFYCSPYLKLNVFRSNPGSRIHPSIAWLLFSKQYLFTLSTQVPIQRSWMITSLHPVVGSA